MPRIEKIAVVRLRQRVLLWLAVAVNDYGQIEAPAFGVTARQATDRCLSKLDP